MSQANEAMQTLTEQWYNAMVTGLGLSAQHFQLYQGSNSIMDTSAKMWDLFNTVPPTSVNNFYNPAQVNNLTSDYNLILAALIANSDNDFQACMGDYFVPWQEYFADHDPVTWDVQGITDLFNKWALKNAPSKTGCVSGLTKAFINPINIAISKFASAGQKYAWNKTIEDLQYALKGGASSHFTLDSKTASKNISHTWAKASASVIFDLFSIGGGGSYDHLSERAISAGLKVDVNFEKTTTFTAGPLAQANSTDPILKSYQPWYDSAALSLAYTTKDNSVWNKQNPVNWDKAFGSSGFLQRVASALVVADGISITMTSSATYNSSDQKTIIENAGAGFWPFFSVKEKGGTSTTVKFDGSGTFTINVNIPLGNPQILGILQAPMSDVFYF
jgi:hypothetical protein